MNRSIFAIYFLIIVPILWSMPSFAFKTYDRDQHWVSGEVQYQINVNYTPGFDESPVIQSAGWDWSSTPADFKFTYIGTTNTATTANDGQNVVYFKQGDGPGGVLGQCTFSYSGSRILDADIWFDTQDSWWDEASQCNGMSLKAVCIHEMGHALGLTHENKEAENPDCPIMQPSIPQCRARRACQDDINGLIYLYGLEEPTCDALGTMIQMPAVYFRAGDPFFCSVFACNPGAETYSDVPLFVLLEISGVFYFAPDFSSFSHYTLDLPPGLTETVVFQSFPWPPNTPETQGIVWYASMTNSEITELFGSMDMMTFGFGP